MKAILTIVFIFISFNVFSQENKSKDQYFIDNVGQYYRFENLLQPKILSDTFYLDNVKHYYNPSKNIYILVFLKKNNKKEYRLIIKDSNVVDDLIDKITYDDYSDKLYYLEKKN